MITGSLDFLDLLSQRFGITRGDLRDVIRGQSTSLRGLRLVALAHLHFAIGHFGGKGPQTT